MHFSCIFRVNMNSQYWFRNSHHTPSTCVNGIGCNIYLFSNLGYLMTGRIFASLIGKSSETLWQILSKLAVIYCLEPAFTIIFVTNMTYIWEKVTANLRSRVFQRVLIQKVFFLLHNPCEFKPC
jgi:hypothetical protein